jgi:hypothetical protein
MKPRETCATELAPETRPTPVEPAKSVAEEDVRRCPLR